MRRSVEKPDTAVVAEALLGRPAVREVVPRDPGLSARWHVHDYPSPIARWNFHPEYEVHLIRATTGRYIVGDTIDLFGPGQLVLVGPDLPHHWISDLEDGERADGRDVVFQFHGSWIRDCQQVLPELCDLDPLLTRAGRGIEFSGDSATAGARDLELIGVTRGAERLRHVFGLLHALSAAPADEYRLLASGWVPTDVDHPQASAVVSEAIEYIFDNLTGSVRLSAAATMSGMSESAFSKYFKRASGQTFSEVVRRFRLAQACKLLQQTSKPISVIAAEVGYVNLSNFNRQFRDDYGITPRQYRAQGKPYPDLR